MDYETDILKRIGMTNPHGANDALKRETGMTPEQRAAFDADNAAFRAKFNAEREAQQKAERAAREADELQRCVETEESARSEAFRAWVGTKASFDAAWPAMYAHQQQQRMEEARRRQAEVIRSNF